MKNSNAWKLVRCHRCDRLYQCTPFDDYYLDCPDWEGEEGICEKCLLELAHFNQIGVVVLTWRSENKEE